MPRNYDSYYVEVSTLFKRARREQVTDGAIRFTRLISDRAFVPPYTALCTRRRRTESSLPAKQGGDLVGDGRETWGRDVG